MNVLIQEIVERTFSSNDLFLILFIIEVFPTPTSPKVIILITFFVVVLSE